MKDDIQERGRKNGYKERRTLLEREQEEHSIPTK